MQTISHSLNVVRKSGSQLYLLVPLYSLMVSDPLPQNWLELNPHVRWVKHPAAVERLRGMGMRFPLIGWTDVDKRIERKRVREREKDHSGEISSLHSETNSSSALTNHTPHNDELKCTEQEEGRVGEKETRDR